MQEIEAKFFIQQIEKMRVRLRYLEAQSVQERILETNLRFDLPDGSLHSTSRVLRLRRDSVSRLTYKGPGESNQGVSSRRELEFTVEDFAVARSFLEALGYQVVFTYEKYRTTFEFNGSHVMLDELPIGNFVEIEGTSAKQIQALARRLDLTWENSITQGYHVLFENLCRKRADLNPALLTFDALHEVDISSEDLSLMYADR